SRTFGPWSPTPSSRGPGSGTWTGRWEGSGAVTWRGRGAGVGVGVGDAEVDGSGEVMTTAWTAVPLGPESEVARETPYPSAQVPASTPEIMATLATLVTPAPMPDIFAPSYLSGRA